MPDVQAGSCRVKAAVERARPGTKMLGKRTLVGALRDQPAPRQVVNDVGRHPVILAHRQAIPDSG